MEARVSWVQDPLPLPLPLPMPAGCPAAWTQDLVTVEVNGRGRAAVTQSMTAGDAGEVIHSLAGEPDVTVTISGSHPAAGKVMIAPSGDNYFEHWLRLMESSHRPGRTRQTSSGDLRAAFHAPQNGRSERRTGSTGAASDSDRVGGLVRVLIVLQLVR
jgi:hypothetical protein